MDKRQVFYALGEFINWCNHYGKQFGSFWKIKERNTMWSSDSTSGYLSEENENDNSERYMHPMFTVALFTRAKTWKTCVHRWLNVWIIHTHTHICSIYAHTNTHTGILPRNKKMKSCIYENTDSSSSALMKCMGQKVKYHVPSHICRI